MSTTPPSPGPASAAPAPARKMSRLKKWLLICAAAAVVFIAMSWGAVAYTSRPAFCTNCHFMQPYYDSWKSSSHRNVECVKCHFEPGIRNTIKAKMVGLSQLMQYMTGREGTMPRAEISDRSCLREGCHETRLLEGPVEFKGVHFDHKHHLGDLRRGKTLRCTSCHSQVVQGKHMTVTETTCFLCHFKGQAFNQGTGKCTTCHEIPTKTFQVRGSAFDHSLVKTMGPMGMDCVKCHSELVRGAGEVPRERCQVCHNRPDDLKRYSDTDFMHTNHVTDHKINCVDCHLSIRHELGDMDHRELTSAGDCLACHAAPHEAQVRMYAGRGPMNVVGTPNRMFLVRADCKGCHEAHGVKAGEKLVWRPNKEACATCHTASKAENLSDWKTVLDASVTEVDELLKKVRAQRAGTAAAAIAAPAAEEADRLIKEAAEDFEFVKKANGVHNVIYAEAVLETATKNLKRASKLLEPPAVKTGE
jgi:predicted CXXCH cytochrome family protein